MEIDNPNLGESLYDYHYGGYRCAYCSGIIIIASGSSTLEVLFQEALERLRLEHLGEDEYFLTCEEEKAIRDGIAEREGGECIAFGQCLHYRCLALLQEPGNKELFSRLLLTNRENMVLPDENPALYTFYDINYSVVRQCLNKCAYCHLELTVYAPGFAYCEKTDKSRHCLYLHNACYMTLKEARCRTKLLEANARRNFAHYVTTGTPSTWARFTIAEMAERNEGWLRFATLYSMTFDERHYLNEWLRFIQQQKALWREQQSTCWFSHITDDMVVMVMELSTKSEEQLTLLEKELTTKPEPLTCVPIEEELPLPSCMPSKENCTRYGPVKTRSAERQLYLNLISALRQSIRENQPQACYASLQ